MEYILHMPPCELVISGKGLFEITTSLLSLGPWVVGHHGELTPYYYTVLLDTIMFAINADYSALNDHGGSCQPNLEDDNENRPALTRALSFRNEVYALSVSLPKRTPQHALDALQLILAMIVHHMYQTYEYDKYIKILNATKDTLVTRLMTKLKSTYMKLSDLEKERKGFTTRALQEQQKKLCELLTSKAANIMSGNFRDNASDLGEEIIDIGSADDGFSSLLKIMTALTDGDSASIVTAATGVSRMMLTRSHYTGENQWLTLLGCARRNSHKYSRVEETNLNKQKEQPGYNAIDAALENVHESRWDALFKFIKSGGRPLTAYDNMSQDKPAHSLQRVGKQVKSQYRTFILNI